MATNNTGLIPADTIRKNANILYGTDRQMLNEYQSGLANGDINIQNHADLSGVGSDWLKKQFAAQRAVQSNAPKSRNKIAGIMEDVNRFRQNLPKPIKNVVDAIPDGTIQINTGGKIGGNVNLRNGSAGININDKVKGAADLRNKSVEIGVGDKITGAVNIGDKSGSLRYESEIKRK